MASSKQVAAVLGGLVVAGAAVALTAGTYAYFSDGPGGTWTGDVTLTSFVGSGFGTTLPVSGPSASFPVTVSIPVPAFPAPPS